MYILPFWKFLSICNSDFIDKIAKKICINNASFLRNPGKSRYCNYIAILPTILMLLTKIIVFKIANALIIEDIKKSNSSNSGLIIINIIDVIFNSSSNSFYMCTGSQNCKDLQIYSNPSDVTITNNSWVGILRNVFFKGLIKSYFFWKPFQL